MKIYTIVGMKFCTDNVDRLLNLLQIGDKVLFELEDDNQHDSNAIRVVSTATSSESKMKIGFISKNENIELRQTLLNCNSGTHTTEKNSSNNNYYKASIACKSNNFISLFVKIYDDTKDEKSLCEAKNVVSTTTATTVLETTKSSDGWISWPTSSSSSLLSATSAMVSIEDYLLHIKPSQIQKTLDQQWIAIKNINKNSIGHDTNKTKNYINHNNFISKISHYCNNKANISILKKAIHDKNLVGKWLLFFATTNENKKESMDSAWMKIAAATSQGQLGCSSKISCCGTNNSVCCVYVNDFTNVLEVKRVLIQLQKVLHIIDNNKNGRKKNNIITGFKPDVYTEYNISGTIYKTNDVLSW